MVDLLGKSDRKIALGSPATDVSTGQPVQFYPGHNKFDANYSIGSLRPDVVVTVPWDATNAEMVAWGYEFMCTTSGRSMYVLRESRNVRWERLTSC